MPDQHNPLLTSMNAKRRIFRQSSRLSRWKVRIEGLAANYGVNRVNCIILYKF